jgi:hypothetical protein
MKEESGDLMILKRTRLKALNSFSCACRFITHGHRMFLSLLLIPLLGASCARPSAIASNRTSPLVYVAVGDSTGIGLGARRRRLRRTPLRADRAEAPGLYHDEPLRGRATTADAVEKQLPRLDGKRAMLVTVCVGMNDLLRGREAKQFAETYETLVARLEQSGRLVIVANLPDISSAPAMQGWPTSPSEYDSGNLTKPSRTLPDGTNCP